MLLPLSALLLAASARTVVRKEEVCSTFADAGPVNAGQDNVHPCDTSFLRSKFPCSEDRVRPCMGAQVQGWTIGTLSSRPVAGDAYAKAPVVVTTNYDYPVIMTVTDTSNQAEHFLIESNGKFIGETGFENGYSNVNTCANNAECSVTRGGYSKGYFLIPAGM